MSLCESFFTRDAHVHIIVERMGEQEKGRSEKDKMDGGNQRKNSEDGDKIETEGDKLQTRLTSFALNRCCRFKRKILKDP